MLARAWQVMEREVGKRVQTVAIIRVRSEDLTDITGHLL